jgi:hypothetical protein
MHTVWLQLSFWQHPGLARPPQIHIAEVRPPPNAVPVPAVLLQHPLPHASSVPSTPKGAGPRPWQKPKGPAPGTPPLPPKRPAGSTSKASGSGQQPAAPWVPKASPEPAVPKSPQDGQGQPQLPEDPGSSSEPDEVDFQISSDDDAVVAEPEPEQAAASSHQDPADRAQPPRKRPRGRPKKQH